MNQELSGQISLLVLTSLEMKQQQSGVITWQRRRCVEERHLAEESREGEKDVFKDRPSTPILRCLDSRASIASFPEINSNSFVRVSWSKEIKPVNPKEHQF